MWKINKLVCGRKASDEFIYVQWKRNLSKREGKQAGIKKVRRKRKYESIN